MKIRTEDGVPEENTTGFDCSADFIHPRVVEGHPHGLVLDVAGLDSLPEIVGSTVVHTRAEGQHMTYPGLELNRYVQFDRIP